ncbi:PLC-like phosphodiesterase [Cristinia sonorae]|uniref:PLC-like phosphodiesterase n=1 Tax=Cristinia sonorae TaxID=1940300 RepID=A0A8K0XLM6_9AGAR|nr:PLC-like phosphodiesterase [Cristinia sonorae]
MLPQLSQLTFLANQALLLVALPAQERLARWVPQSRFYDVQAHRGGRGNTVENTLPSFAWGLIDGATTLELDNGITKDGVVVVWHDEEITAEKCIDTAPVVPNDPDFPYVGKFVANLTLAQIKTLDCGSKRQDKYRTRSSFAFAEINSPSLTYPGTKISTLEEVFDFVSCADPSHQILWNIESKINAQYPNQTRSVEDFVTKQYAAFAASPYYNAITYQSFDWRSLVAMKKVDPYFVTSALIDEYVFNVQHSAPVPDLPLSFFHMAHVCYFSLASQTAANPDNNTTPWLAGLRLDAFPGPTAQEQIAQAAHHVGANILSPAATSSSVSSIDPSMEGYVPFTTKGMVDEAHRLGLLVKPWTVNRMNVAEEILNLKVDGIITDYPNVVRRLVKSYNLPAAPKYPKQRVLSCLASHLQLQRESISP